MNEIETIELDVRNEHKWFELDQEKLCGGIETLERQGVIRAPVASWMCTMIRQLETHFKALEIEYYKMKDIAQEDKQ